MEVLCSGPVSFGASWAAGSQGAWGMGRGLPRRNGAWTKTPLLKPRGGTKYRKVGTEEERFGIREHEAPIVRPQARDYNT
jgi:hypothetical protein